jgi:alpha-D-ribose 1-methylphosphonate 5-triphosphate synthase subunit PhnG
MRGCGKSWRALERCTSTRSLIWKIGLSERRIRLRNVSGLGYNYSVDKKKSKSKKQELLDYTLQHKNLKAKFSELKAALEDSLETNPED